MKARIGSAVFSHRDAQDQTWYSVEVWHDGFTNGHRTLRDIWDLRLRESAEDQAKAWDREWSEVSRKKALERTLEARQALEDLASILKRMKAYTLNWVPESDREPFTEPKPALGNLPTEPQLPREPQASDPAYQGAMRGLFDTSHEVWKFQMNMLSATRSAALRAHEEEIHRLKQQHEAEVAAWQQRKAEHEAKQAASKAKTDRLRAAYESLVPRRVAEYCGVVLEISEYPAYFPRKWEIGYDASSRTLIVDYVLPAPDDLPTVKAVKYVASRGETEDQHISDAQAAKLYDEVLYQVVLRTVHELFEHDSAHALTAVVLNGIVTAVDRRTGKPVTACVLSLRANRDEFLNINLAQVDAKACFKMLKGVGSSKLHGLAPVAPIMPLNRDDGRFVPAYEVANTLDDSVNLAAMEWADFEHLIRELFEQEFARTGGEVKVTQASRDGGVDAIAFDPDPIRGGKIIIQAKRYTNTVGVSAVRDLYGTVLNEGATKGVLVTTSDYGPDSYAFAAGKPLVLLSGANLLHMLEKHGRKARIDLIEAKKLMAGT